MEIDVQSLLDRIEGAREHRRPSDYAFLLENKIATLLAQLGLYDGNRDVAQSAIAGLAHHAIANGVRADSQGKHLDLNIQNIDGGRQALETAIVGMMYAIEACVAERAGLERDAWTLILDGENRLQGIRAALGVVLGDKEGAKGRASLGAKTKHRKDPKQIAKTSVLELWKERHAGKHPELRRVQDFAAEVMRRWPALKNSKTIEGWSAKWTKEVKAGKNPSC